MRVRFVQIDASAYAKAPALARFLGLSLRDTMGLLALLFQGAIDHAHHSQIPDGIVSGPQRAFLIASWCQWSGDHQKLLDGLELFGFLEPAGLEKLRVRGTSRYFRTIEKNSRPNAKQRERLKKKQVSEEARAGLAGPSPGQRRASNYNSNSMPLSSYESLPDEPDSEKPPPPPPKRSADYEGGKVVDLHPRPAQAKEKLKAAVAAGYEHQGVVGDEEPITLGFFVGKARQLRERKYSGLPEEPPQKLHEFWADVEREGCANGRILMAYWRFLQDKALNQEKPMAVFIRPSIWRPRIGETVRAPKERRL